MRKIKILLAIMCAAALTACSAEKVEETLPVQVEIPSVVATVPTEPEEVIPETEPSKLLVSEDDITQVILQGETYDFRQMNGSELENHGYSIQEASVWMKMSDRYGMGGPNLQHEDGSEIGVENTGGMLGVITAKYKKNGAQPAAELVFMNNIHLGMSYNELQESIGQYEFERFEGVMYEYALKTDKYTLLIEIDDAYVQQITLFRNEINEPIQWETSE